MRGQGKGAGGRGRREQRGAGAGKQARSQLKVPSQGTGGPTWHRRSPPQVCSRHRLSGFVPGFRTSPCPLQHPLWVSFCLSPLASVSLTFSLSLHVSFHLHFSVPIPPWPSSSHCSCLSFYSPPASFTRGVNGVQLTHSSCFLQPLALLSSTLPLLQACCLLSSGTLRFGVGWGNQEGGLKNDFLGKSHSHPALSPSFSQCQRQLGWGPTLGTLGQVEQTMSPRVIRWLWGNRNHQLPQPRPCPGWGALELTLVMKLAAMCMTWIRAQGSHI